MRSIDLSYFRRLCFGVTPQSIALVVVIATVYWWAIIPVLAVAIRAACGFARLPAPLSHVLTRLPVAFPIHMAASAGALALVPVVVAAYRAPALHRPLGQLAVACIVVGSLTSFAVSAQSTASFMTKCGFAAQGLAWLILSIAGIAAIRYRRVRLHRRLMTAVAIVTISPVALRILMRVAIAERLPFQTTYAIIAWAVWLVPLALYTAACLVFQLEAAHVGLPLYSSKNCTG